MSLYGYARVSTLDQDLNIQRAAFKAADCKVIRAEKASGSRLDGRTELQVLLDFVQPGDTLAVSRIDRLVRSMKDLQDIVHELKEKNVALRATEQSVDTGTAVDGGQNPRKSGDVQNFGMEFAVAEAAPCLRIDQTPTLGW